MSEGGAARLRVAIVSNGNAFATLMVRPLFEEPDVEVAGAVLVRVPPGGGGRGARLWRLARRTGWRYAAHKLGTLAVPQAYGAATRRPVFLDGLCRRHGVPFLDAPSVNSEAARAFLERLRPDVLVSASTPERIRPEVLELAGLAAVNVHWALLPRYAGIAPYFWVLRHGEHRTGVTVHVMAPELDVGPVLRQRELAVGPNETSLGLQLRLARAGAEELLAAVAGLPASLDRAEPQDLAGRSYFTWPSPSDVAALRRRGRRLARRRDYADLLRALRGDS